MGRLGRKVADEERFKRWLIDKLKTSRWPYSATLTVPELSKKLGVQPSVLLQAQLELDQERKAAGLPLVRLGDPARAQAVQAAQVTMQLPREVYEAWKASALNRGLTMASLLRSALHELLSRPAGTHHQPTSSWVLNGTAIPLPWKREHGTRGKVLWPYWVRCTVTRGAKQALTRRATSAGVTEFALLRALMLDVLSGHLSPAVYLTTLSGMWEDPERYVLEDQTWTPKNAKSRSPTR